MPRPHKKIKAKRKAAQRAATGAVRPPRRGITLVVALRARPGQEAALEKELLALVSPTRAERGCIAYELLASSDQPGLFLFHEIWRSLEHLKGHWETPHMKRFGERRGALVATRESSFWKQLA